MRQTLQFVKCWWWLVLGYNMESVILVIKSKFYTIFSVLLESVTDEEDHRACSESWNPLIVGKTQSGMMQGARNSLSRDSQLGSRHQPFPARLSGWVRV